MSDPNTDPRAAFAEAIALQAFIWGYPLIESVRTCRLTTVPGDSRAAPQATETGLGRLRMPINAFMYSDAPATDRSRDVVTPANDLLYATAWLNLAGGPVLLRTPQPTGRYFVMSLLDAYTNNFRNLGTREVGDRSRCFAIVGPRWTGELPADAIEVRAPTDLVWMLGRVLVDDFDDLQAARALQRGFTLQTLPSAAVPRPSCVEAWREPEPGESPARVFFENLARAVADNPPDAAERPLVAWFEQIGLTAGAPWVPPASPAAQAAIERGWHNGLAYIEHMTRSPRAKPWALSFRLGRWDNDYVPRATVAMKGLGALSGDEALYAMSDFDGERAPLSGANDYVLHFPAGEEPPCDAFWSVTMYGEDFFLVPNEIGRFAIGDRTRGVRRDPDGGLTLRIQHAAPAETSNWLPAPAGRFYLILRLYQPRAEVRGWTIPPLQCTRRASGADR